MNDRSKFFSVFTGLLWAGSTFVIFSSGCSDKHPFDASGAFEADEILVPAEATGIIRHLPLREGDHLDSGEVVGYIDSFQLDLKRRQLRAQIRSVTSRQPDIAGQTAFYDNQYNVTRARLDNLLQEEARFTRLVSADAATKKQLDDISALVRETREQLKVIEEQKRAQVSVLRTQRAALASDVEPLDVQVQQIEDQLRKCRIINPVSGTVLTRFAYAGEMISAGHSVYKIADLRMMILRAYVSGDQLPTIRLNQSVEVLTDDGQGGFRADTGRIAWISDKAEFTPKTIQTKAERANLVYAIKVEVPNDGRYKIGMYGEVNFR